MFTQCFLNILEIVSLEKLFNLTVNTPDWGGNLQLSWLGSSTECAELPETGKDYIGYVGAGLSSMLDTDKISLKITCKSSFEPYVAIRHHSGKILF